MPRILILLFAASLLIGCGETESQAPLESVTGVVEANLALADQLDGSKDHTVGKCYVCALGMDGKPEFSIEVQGYRAQLCSEHCRDHFAQNWRTIIGDTKIPNPNGY